MPLPKFLAFLGPYSNSDIPIRCILSSAALEVPNGLKVFTESEDQGQDGAEDVEVVRQDEEREQAVARVLEILADQDGEGNGVESEDNDGPEQHRDPGQPESEVGYKSKNTGVSYQKYACH